MRLPLIGPNSTLGTSEVVILVVSGGLHTPACTQYPNLNFLRSLDIEMHPAFESISIEVVLLFVRGDFAQKRVVLSAMAEHPPAFFSTTRSRNQKHGTLDS